MGSTTHLHTSQAHSDTKYLALHLLNGLFNMLRKAEGSWQQPMHIPNNVLFVASRVDVTHLQHSS